VIHSRPINPNLIINNAQGPDQHISHDEGEVSNKSNKLLLSPQHNVNGHSSYGSKEEIKEQMNVVTYEAQRNQNRSHNQALGSAEKNYSSPFKNTTSIMVDQKRSTTQLLE